MAAGWHLVQAASRTCHLAATVADRIKKGSKLQYRSGMCTQQPLATHHTRSLVVDTLQAQSLQQLLGRLALHHLQQLACWQSCQRWAAVQLCPEDRPAL
jgi:hypothetical protein